MVEAWIEHLIALLLLDYSVMKSSCYSNPSQTVPITDEILKQVIDIPDALNHVVCISVLYCTHMCTVTCWMLPVHSRAVNQCQLNQPVMALYINITILLTLGSK